MAKRKPPARPKFDVEDEPTWEEQQKRRFRWGFQWGKVGGGIVMLLIGGGLTVVMWFGGEINLWAIGLAVIGLFTMLAGLIGEEGVW